MSEIRGYLSNIRK